MKIKFKKNLSLFKTAFKEWNEKDPFRQSAVIAYYAIFSLPGLLVVIITLAGYFFGRDAVSGHLSGQISATMGKDTADQVQGMIAVASETKNSMWAAIIGVATIILGATGVFEQLQKTFNIIWEVEPVKSKSGLWNLIRARVFSFGLIISIAFILLISLVVSTILAALGTWVSNHFSEAFLVVLQLISSVISLAILAMLFACMFKFLPDAKIKWRHVWIGSFITALLFEIGKFALGLYFGKADPASGYGAAGSVILILLWTSYSSMIVFYGAEYTRAYVSEHDGKILPDKIAVKKTVTKKDL